MREALFCLSPSDGNTEPSLNSLVRLRAIRRLDFSHYVLLCLLSTTNIGFCIHVTLYANNQQLLILIA